MRGGVSIKRKIIEKKEKFSPYTRGCIIRFKADDGSEFIFPLHEGVYHWKIFKISWRPCLPLTRGGVSHTVRKFCDMYLFSPYQMGCIIFPKWVSGGLGVFPLHEGVYRVILKIARFSIGIPLVRGGISHNYFEAGN